MFKLKSHSIIVIFATLLTACGGGGGSPSPETLPDNAQSPAPTPVSTPSPEPTPTPSETQVFIEEDGVVVVEMESTHYQGTAWQLKSDVAAYGGAAIEWTGADLFTEPGSGLININVKITNTGVYRFDWANQIGEGNSTTEANDSWLKIESYRFFAQTGNAIVCPKGLDSTKNACTGEAPEGAGKLGWFKVYRHGGDVTQYIWRAKTSDGDPHEIYAEFTSPGIYTIQVSGRSKHHVIDRFIMTNHPDKHEGAKNQDQSATE